MIIGLCGLQGSGKDTVASHLIVNHGFVKLSFAGVLKDILSAIFGWDRGRLEGITKEDREWREEVDEWWSRELNIPNFTPRYAMQYFGTDLFRNHFHKDIWLLCVKRRLSSISRNIVITDCRFDNEIEMVKSMENSHIIYLERDPLPDWVHVFNDIYDFNTAEEREEEFKRLRIHPSDYLLFHREHYGEGFPNKILNNGSIKDLYGEVDTMIRGFASSD